MNYFFNKEQNIFSEQYKVELTEEDLTFSKLSPTNKEEKLLQVLYNNIVSIHLQAIEIHDEEEGTSFMDSHCIIKVDTISQPIIIRGDNSHSYTIFLNYLHGHCSFFSNIAYTYEVNYRLRKPDESKGKKYSNDYVYFLYVLAPIAIIMIYFDFLIMFIIILIIFCCFLFFSENTIIEEKIEQGSYEPEQRPESLLF